MPPILIIVNVLVVAVALVVLSAISTRYRKLFALGAFIPLVILVIITLLSRETTLGLKEAVFFLLRGGLVFAVFSGLLTCYLVSRRSQSTRDMKGE